MSAILFATRSLPNALNKEIVGDLSHIARCRSALGPGSVEIGGCDVMRVITTAVVSSYMTRIASTTSCGIPVTLYEYTFTYLIDLEEGPGPINNTGLPKRTPSLQDTVPNMAKSCRGDLRRLVPLLPADTACLPRRPRFLFDSPRSLLLAVSSERSRVSKASSDGCRNHRKTVLSECRRHRTLVGLTAHLALSANAPVTHSEPSPDNQPTSAKVRLQFGQI
ncbi:hypothetical protein Bbelb_361570 [Branchiostoma belcheri]|nr:hypothetical protein Bbelb_361570 [Branchiostoma belcheri]